MTFDVPVPSEPLHQRDDTNARSRRLRWGVRIAVLAVGLGTFLLLWFMVRPPEERDAVEHLSAPERSALFTRTLTNVSSVCAGPEARELNDFCRSEAELLVEFPECDEHCLSLARPLITKPSR